MMIIQPLQTAIYTALSGDSALAALITGVHYFVPQDARQSDAGIFPFIEISDSTNATLDTTGANGFLTEFTLEIWSRYKGAKETAQIMDEIYRIFHRQPIAVEGYSTSTCSQTAANITRDADGITMHGVQKFEVYSSVLLTQEEV